MIFGLDIENKKKVIKYLSKISKGSGDARPLWTALIYKITEFINYEFHDTADGHKLWQTLYPPYKSWKERNGKASGIGVMDGKMREGAGKEAIKQIKRKSLTWILNQADVESVKGFKYAPVFNKGSKDGKQPARPIFKYTAFRINSFIRRDDTNFEKGRAGLISNWFRKVLREAERV